MFLLIKEIKFSCEFWTEENVLSKSVHWIRGNRGFSYFMITAVNMQDLIIISITVECKVAPFFRLHRFKNNARGIYEPTVQVLIV